MKRSKSKTPTNKEKIQMYEQFLHDLHGYLVCYQHDKINDLVGNASWFSYMHNSGNGMLTKQEQQKGINIAFWNLRKVKY